MRMRVWRVILNILFVVVLEMESPFYPNTAVFLSVCYYSNVKIKVFIMFFLLSYIILEVQHGFKLVNTVLYRMGDKCGRNYFRRMISFFPFMMIQVKANDTSFTPCC